MRRDGKSILRSEKSFYSETRPGTQLSTSTLYLKGLPRCKLKIQAKELFGESFLGTTESSSSQLIVFRRSRTHF